jgi:replicative DNA helicase
MKNPFKTRLACREAKIEFKNFEFGLMNEMEWARFTRAWGTIHDRLEKVNEPKKTR